MESETEKLPLMATICGEDYLLSELEANWFGIAKAKKQVERFLETTNADKGA